MSSNQREHLGDVLNLAKDILSNYYREDLATQLALKISADVEWMHGNDPASQNKEEIELRSSCIAIAYYRLANLIQYELEDREGSLILYDKSKKTGIDINPGAKIGVPFAIDHGIGTVIGETCEIGDSCLLLNNVTLGAIEVGSEAGSKLRGEKRHPIIQDKVTICNNARILGPVIIGHNSFIGSYSLITTDIPPYSEVSCVAQMQIIKTDRNIHKQPPVVSSFYPSHMSIHNCDIINITGHGFDNNTRVEFLHRNNGLDEVVIHPLTYESRTSNAISLKVNKAEFTYGQWDLRVINSDGQWFTLTRCFYFISKI